MKTTPRLRNLRSIEMSRFAPALLVAILFVSGAAAQDQQPTTREAMWFAPTAEDWAKPCLIHWQRTYEDAQAVSKETGKAILVCVNMDGEIASEHYAGVRYRQPEIAALYEPYVCVIASVYRHAPRDFDEQGRRILCPRFGSVTCGEHIAIEAGLYEKFMDGVRVAPRHIGVELDGKEMYDIFYAWDTDTIFNNLKSGIAARPKPPAPEVRGDRSIIEKVKSRDNADRSDVEKAFADGDAAQRRAILEAAATAGGDAPIEVLRLALQSLDADLQGLARKALALSKSPEALDLISDALRAPMADAERSSLLGALDRIGESSERARTLAVVHRGLGGKSSTVDVEKWSAAMAEAPKYQAATDEKVISSRLAGLEKAYTDGDAEKRIELAESFITLAQKPDTDSQFVNAFYQDALRAVAEAEKVDAKGWRLDAVAAVANYYLGNVDDARKRAESAMSDLPQDAQSWNSMVVLGLFADARREAVDAALRAKREWPPQWLSDLNAAYGLLARHPFGDDGHVAAHYDLVRRLGGLAQATRILDAGLERFPESWALNDRLRGRVLATKGAEGLETMYDEALAKADAPARLHWFAGYAAVVAAEFHRRQRDPERAMAAYEKGIAHYERYVAASPDERESADHRVAVALAGRARLFLERGEFEKSVDTVCASFDRAPLSAATLDGLNISAVDTAKMLVVRLERDKNEDLAKKVKEALGRLDPKMLELPAFERPAPGTDGRPSTRPNRRPQDRRNN